MTIADALMSDWDGKATVDDFELKTYPPGDVDFEIFGRMAPAWRMHVVSHDLSTLIKAKRRNNRTTPSKGTALKTIGRSRQATFLKLNRPPAEAFRKQLRHVRTYADLRQDRLHEILAQRGDILTDFGLAHFLEANRSKWTVTLLLGVQSLMSNLEMPLKYLTYCPRPIDYSRRVMPTINTPTHGTFPSGHACEAFAIATVLECLTTPKRLATDGNAPGQEQFETFIREIDTMEVMRIAARIAENRVVAGVHFPIDNAAGALTGVAVGLYCVWALASSCGVDSDADDMPSIATGNALLPKFKMRGNEWGSMDFSLEIFKDNLEVIKDRDCDNIPMSLLFNEENAIPVPRASRLLQRLWKEAAKEWLPVIGA